MRKFLLITSLVIISLITLFFVFAVYVDYSDGDRAGNVVKLSRKGMLFKTWEGELNTGALTDGTGGTWKFSVAGSEQKVINDIRNAMDHGYRVRLTYEEKYIKLFWRGDTKYFVTKAEAVRY